MLRFPDGMRDQISEAAKASGRSMNAEIVTRLQSSFAASPQHAESQLTATREHIQAAQERGRTYNYALVLAFIAERIPEGAFADLDFVESALKEVRDAKHKVMLEIGQQMMNDIRTTASHFNAAVASGALRVIGDDGKPIPPEQVRPWDLDAAVAKAEKIIKKPRRRIKPD